MERKLTKKQKKVADVFDNKVYKTEDVKLHLIRKGYDMVLVDSFFNFLKDQVREAAEDEEMINIQIRNFGSLYFSFHTYSVQKAKAKAKIENNIKFNQPTKENEELLKFIEDKYQTLKSYKESLKKSYKGSSKLEKKKKLYKDIHNDGTIIQ